MLPNTGQSAPSPALETPTADHRHIGGVGIYPGLVHGKPAKLLALDVGLARIGLAVCDPLQLLARPLYTLHRRSRRQDFAELAQVVTQQEIQALVCGLPLHMDGSEGEQAATTRKWALRLTQALRAILGDPRPLVFWDERLSTYAAQEIMQIHKLAVEEDAAAAAVILQSYLDAIRHAPPPTFDAIVLPQSPATEGNR